MNKDAYSRYQEVDIYKNIVQEDIINITISSLNIRLRKPGLKVQSFLLKNTRLYIKSPHLYAAAIYKTA